MPNFYHTRFIYICSLHLSKNKSEILKYARCASRGFMRILFLRILIRNLQYHVYLHVHVTSSRRHGQRAVYENLNITDFFLITRRLPLSICTRAIFCQEVPIWKIVFIWKTVSQEELSIHSKWKVFFVFKKCLRKHSLSIQTKRTVLRSLTLMSIPKKSICSQNA